MMMSWTVAFASVAGTSHHKNNTPCQDTGTCRLLTTANGEEILVGVISDGAGSASRSDIGSLLACDLFIDEIAALIDTGGDVRDINRDFGVAWLTRFHNEINARAEAEQTNSRDFACTVLAAVISNSWAAFFQVGDGAIVVDCPEDGEEYMWIFWPQKGEYENQTFFATDEKAAERLEHDLIERPIQEIALFTDGLQRLALHFESQTAFSPLFRKMLVPLRCEKPGISTRLSQSLISFLNSEAVNNRTDDDKTLLLASRRLNPDAAASKKDLEKINDGSDCLR